MNNVKKIKNDKKMKKKWRKIAIFQKWKIAIFLGFFSFFSLFYLIFFIIFASSGGIDAQW